MCVETVARVVALEGGDSHVAVVEDATGLHRVSLALLALEGGCAVAPGDWVAVHTGLVVRRVDGEGVATSRSTT